MGGSGSLVAGLGRGSRCPLGLSAQASAPIRHPLPRSRPHPLQQGLPLQAIPRECTFRSPLPGTCSGFSEGCFLVTGGSSRPFLRSLEAIRGHPQPQAAALQLREPGDGGPQFCCWRLRVTWQDGMRGGGWLALGLCLLPRALEDTPAKAGRGGRDRRCTVVGEGEDLTRRRGGGAGKMQRFGFTVGRPLAAHRRPPGPHLPAPGDRWCVKSLFPPVEKAHLVPFSSDTSSAE